MDCNLNNSKIKGVTFRKLGKLKERNNTSLFFNKFYPNFTAEMYMIIKLTLTNFAASSKGKLSKGVIL